MFEWDEQKSQQCRLDRGFDFSLIEQFDFHNAVIHEDKRQDYGERRFRAFGFINGVLYAVAFVLRGQNIRIISMRRMHKKEGVRYGLIKNN